MEITEEMDLDSVISVTLSLSFTLFQLWLQNISGIFRGSSSQKKKKEKKKNFKCHSVKKTWQNPNRPNTVCFYPGEIKPEGDSDLRARPQRIRWAENKRLFRDV